MPQGRRVRKEQISAAWKRADPDGQEPRPAPGTDLLRARAYLALLLGQPVDAPPLDLLPGAAAPAPDAAPRPEARRARGVPHGSSAYPGPGQPGPDGTGTPGYAPDGIPGPSHRRDGEPADGAPAPDLPPGPGDALPPLAGQVFLTLPLATLLGLSDAPGQAAGYGPVDPDTGRALARAAAGHPAAGWHLIITDPHGRAIGYGHAPRARPAPGHPAPGHPADGWTIMLTTERIARGQSP